MLKPTPLQDNTHGLTVSDSHGGLAPLAVAATFTADPLKEVIEFWLAQLDLNLEVVLTDYNQVFQQLLNPVSLMAQNTQGINLLLIRIEDWLRFQTSEDRPEEDRQTTLAHRTVLERNGEDLVSAISEAVKRSSTPHIVVFCPSNPTISAEQLSLHQQIEKRIIEELTPTNNLHLVSSATVFSRYPVSNFYQANGDLIGHIPFTPEAFAALGTTIARMVYALKREPYKVIALDCDRTLWRGICGEDGPMGIAVDKPFQALQSFMVRCSQAGFLLCLCSKNVEEDVWQVFDQRDDMPLGREHLVGWRINWQPKSENLRSLAAELNLGLDSFIFIDDNPVECSEVQARCPEVLTLQLPENPDQIPNVLNHIWPLDTLKVTDADSHRTQLYQQNSARQRFEREAEDFNAFIEGLQLDVTIEEPTPEQLPRVSQLTQRTNQFNATTCRRSEAEIQTLRNDGYGCRAVTVCDRFGDYGLVGVILFHTQQNTLNVDTFLLSCRVLGRGVEHRMVAHLGEVAAAQGLSSVRLNYQPTAKNLPIAEFFKTIGQPYVQSVENGFQYALPVKVAQQLNFTAPAPAKDKQSNKKEISQTSRPLSNREQYSKSTRWNHIVRALQHPTQILEHVEQQGQRTRDNTGWIAPKTPTEKSLSKIWSKVLRMDRISLSDNLFDLGNTSLLSVSAFAAIEEMFGQRLPMTILLDAPTIEELAIVIDAENTQDVWKPLVAGRRTGNKQPIYIVHGGYGDVLSTAQIINCLDDDQPVYILRAIGLDGQQLPLTSIEAMAAAYISAIKEEQPLGPYQLCGQCAGGIVAYEMAQQLTAQGETVNFLGLLDSPHPQLENHFTNRFRYYFHHPTYRHHPWDRTYYLFKAIYYVRRLKTMLKYHSKELKQRSFQQKLQYIGNKLGRVQSKLGLNKRVAVQPTHRSKQSDRPPSSVIPTSPSTNKDKFTAKEQYIKDRFVELFLRAQENYIPQPYPGKIDFFLATQQTFVPKHRPHSLAALRDNASDVDDVKQLLFGWDKLVPQGNFNIRCVDCPHPQMMQQPHVAELGRVLQATLDEYRNQSSIGENNGSNKLAMAGTSD
ncbi:HAD-IIIC family phosphatase [Leptolyngbya cf. ectocarpi LEGE 11479]|uniref:HAD-IIIC family phosphatase n=1 Tax=Leptolyngbya cf. ectocarpi LEGE 11479 TaxID=1828722 RepID=A0A928ZYI6_LEPEC|nr:HAD-IIIC family phosphatase [Leptolyngbya ectocarpi]MBE9069778.1 HAD-IIIC family phosphatase [Leptolyngbya cf. ectocarpi LEGE 11479]